ncbi:MAG: mismatch repair protein MutT [Chitinophagaceae bacterium]|nr:mismatch repair protein MutT [Chitinophagaceae bacterium]
MNDEQLKWKLLSSEYVFDDKWLRARKDTCEKPDGSLVKNYYVIEYMEWVTALCITEDQKVVMVKQYRHALGEVCLELPGGCVDDTDASFDVAIKREALEETGYEFEKLTYLGNTSPNPSTNTNRMHMYLLQGGKKVQGQQLDANEQIEIVILTIPELLEKLKRNEIIQSMHVTTIFYALQQLGILKADV